MMSICKKYCWGKYCLGKYCLVVIEQELFCSVCCDVQCCKMKVHVLITASVAVHQQLMCFYEGSGRHIWKKWKLIELWHDISFSPEQNAIYEPVSIDVFTSLLDKTYFKHISFSSEGLWMTWLNYFNKPECFYADHCWIIVCSYYLYILSVHTLLTYYLYILSVHNICT